VSIAELLLAGAAPWLAALAPPQDPPPAPVQGPPAPAELRSPQSDERPEVVAIEITGAERYSEGQLAAALGQRAGTLLDLRAIDAGLKRLWTNFRVRGEVTLVEVEGGVVLRLAVVELPSDREPRFTGNVKVDEETLRRWALLEGQTELFIHQAERVRQRLLEGYAREGFHFAEVNIVKRGEGEGLPDVIFEIREGPKVRVKRFEFRGNRSMPDERFLYFFKGGLSHLSKRKLNPPSLFNWFGTPFVRETLEADLLAMRQVYRDRGWLDAIVELERLEFSPDRRGVVIHVAVDEGRPYAVSELSIETLAWEGETQPAQGVPQAAEPVFPEAELLALCELERGARFEKRFLDHDRLALRDHYGDQGYLAHSSLPPRLAWEFLDPHLVFDVERHTVAVTYRIVQGKKLKLREILFSGSAHTRDRVLRRELSVFPGEYADLREINRSLARIQATGYFQDDMNRLEHRDPTYRFLPVAGESDVVDLEFQVEEGRVVDFNVSGGVDSNDGLFGLISLTMRNFDLSDPPSSLGRVWSEIYNKEAFHGGGQLLQLELAPGTELSRFRARFLEPDVFRRHLEPISFEGDLFKQVRLYETHDEDRFAQSFELGRKFSHDTSGAIGFLNTILEVDDLESDAPPGLRQQAQLDEHDFQTLTLALSSRSLDNLRIPRRGYSATLSGGLTDDLFGGEFEMLETELRTSFYLPAYEKADGTMPIWHFALNGGVTYPQGDTDEVPYSERYFLGGTRSLRGFDFREVGPFFQQPTQNLPGQTRPGEALGGETTVYGTLEFHYPLHSVVQPGTYERLESLRGTLFLDFGILDPDALELDPDELRASIGFGVGLAWPIPIALNFGFPILEEDGDGERLFSFTIGGR
jgi:outer membrane protein insertion porin family